MQKLYVQIGQKKNYFSRLSLTLYPQHSLITVRNANIKLIMTFNLRVRLK